MVTPGEIAVWSAGFWSAHGPEIRTLALYAAGIATYAVVVFAFERFVSARDMSFATGAGKARGGAIGVLRWLLLFPAVTSAYAALIVVSLFALSKSLTADQMVLTAASLAAGIRVTAYVSEAAAEEVARIVPLGLLGVVIVDPGYLDLAVTMERFRNVAGLLPLASALFAAVVVLEVALRIVGLLRPRRRRERAADLVPVKPTVRVRRARE